MPAIVKFEGDDGAFMYVRMVHPEVVGRDPVDDDVELVLDPSESATKALSALETSLGSVRGAAVALMAMLGGLESGDGTLMLDDVTLELGLAFGLEGGIVVAKGSAAAEASVSLTWKARART